MKTILTILDIAYASSREQLAGIYRFRQTHSDWDIRLIPSNDPRFQPAILQSLADNVDGAIVKVGSALDTSSILGAKDIPLVLIERPAHEQIETRNGSDRPFAVVGIDNGKVGRLAASHLTSLGNFASYLYIHDPNDNEWSRLRGKAFDGALRRQRHRAQFLSLPEFKRTLPTIRTPMAIFVGFDLLAVDVLKVCHQAKLSIPSDAAILSVDNDTFLCENTRPTLSSIRLDHENLGFYAAKALDAIISGKRTNPNKELAPLDVIVRNSTTYLPPARHLVERTMQIIESQGSKRIRIHDITRQLGVSQSLLKLRFHQIRNCSLRETLTAKRLEETKRLLKSTNYPVKCIAQMCGFSSSVILNHLFKRKTGMSPRQWRKEEVRREDTRFP